MTNDRDRKVRINEGTVKKGNTSPPPAQSRPAAPAGQGPKSSGGSGAKSSSSS
jgi:hypothetical protein